MNRFLAGIKIAIVLIGLSAAIVLLIVVVEAATPDTQPTLVEVPSTQEVVVITSEMQAEPTLTPDEMRYHMEALTNFFSSIDWCKSGYILATISNLEGATYDVQAYFNEYRMGREPDPMPLQGRQNTQTMLDVGVVTCKLAPTIASLFEALGDTSISIQQ